MGFHHSQCFLTPGSEWVLSQAVGQAGSEPAAVVLIQLTTGGQRSPGDNLHRAGL